MSSEDQTTSVDGGLVDTLSEAQLGRLRAGFDEAALSNMATSLVVADFPSAGALTLAVQAVLYASKRPFEMSSIDRERLLIGLLAAQGLERQLAVHIYWGLMVGLSPRAVGETVVLMGVYNGLARQNEAMGVIKKTLAALAEVAGTRRRKPVPIAEALSHLLAVFPS